MIAGVGVVLTEAFNKIGADLESGFLVAEKRSRLSVREGIHWRTQDIDFKKSEKASFIKLY